MRENKMNSKNFKRAFKSLGAFVLALAMVVTLLASGYGTMEVKAETTISITLGDPSNISSIGTQTFTYPNLTVTSSSNISAAVISVTNGAISNGLPTEVAGSVSVFTDTGKTSATISYNTAQTAGEIQSMLRGITFKSTSAAKPATVKITIDANNTYLPSGASITAGTAEQGLAGHYYMYVSDSKNWFEAYDASKTYYFMGMRGYLVTITSAAEDAVLDNITKVGAWSGGSRYNNSNGKDANTFVKTSTLNDYFKWCCGPEAEVEYYTSSYGDGTAYNNAYNNWPAYSNGGTRVWGQPDGGGADKSGVQTGEACMQVHFDTTKTWNDLSYSYNVGHESTIKGFFVEFGGYSASSTNTDKTGNAALRASDTSLTCTFNANPIVTGQTVTIDGATADSKTKAYSYTSSATYGELPAAASEGYEFLGWYTAAEGGDRITKYSSLGNSVYRTLYAHWAAVTGEVYDSDTVTFGGAGATYSTETVTAQITTNGSATDKTSVTLCDASGNVKYSLVSTGTGTYTATHTYINNAGAGAVQDASNSTDAASYQIYVDGVDTGRTMSFASGSNDVTLAYSKSVVTFKQDGVVTESLADSVELRPVSGSSSTTTYTMQKIGTGASTYYEVNALGDTGTYEIYADDVDTGYSVALGNNQTVEFGSVKVTTNLNGSACDIGSVELRKTESGLTKTISLNRTGTGIYEITSNLSEVGTGAYEIYVNDIDSGKPISFTNSAVSTATANYATAKVTVQLNDVNSTEPVSQIYLSTSKTENTKTAILANNGDGTFTNTQPVGSSSYYVWTDDTCLADTYCVKYSATESEREKIVPYYSVSYDTNGGTGTVSDSVNILTGSKVVLADKGNLVNTGKVFNGWLVNTDTTPTEVGSDITIASQTIIKANWLDGSSCEAKWTDQDGNEYYGTLEEAIAAGNEESGPVTITLQYNVTLDESVQLGTNITLNVPKNTTLTIGDDVTLTNNGTIINEGTVGTSSTGSGTGTIDNKGTLDGSGAIAEDGTPGGIGTFNIAIDNAGGIVEDGIYTNDVTGGTYRGDITVQENTATGTVGTFTGATPENGGNITVPGGTITFDDDGVPTNLDQVFGGQAEWVSSPAPGHIEITGDVILSDPIVITQDVAIDLNGNDIMGAAGEDAIQVSGGTLTVEDNSSAGNGSILGGAGDETHPNGGSGISLSGPASVTLDDSVNVSGGNGYTPGYGNSNSTTSAGGNGGSGITTRGTGTITIGAGTTVSGGSGGSSNGGNGGTGGTAVQIGNGGDPVINIEGSVEGGAGGGARGFDDDGNLVGAGGNGGTGIEVTGSGTLDSTKVTTGENAEVTGGQGGIGKTSGSTGNSKETNDGSDPVKNTRTEVTFICTGASENASYTLYREGTAFYDAETDGNLVETLGDSYQPKKTGSTFNGYYYYEAGGVKVYVVNSDGTWNSVSGNYTTLYADMTEDASAPTGEIFVDDVPAVENPVSDSSTAVVSNVSFSHIYTNAKDIMITASDDAMTDPTVYYYVSGQALTSSELEDESVSWTLYTDTFTEEPSDPCNKFVVYVKIVDVAGNTTYLSSDGYQLSTADAQTEVYSEADLDRAIELGLTDLVLKNDLTVSTDTALNPGTTLDTGDHTLTVDSGVTLTDAGTATESGTIKGTVENRGTISGGIIEGSVDNTNGTIDSATLAENSRVTGGTVSGTTVNEGSITDATFTGSVDNTNGTISSTDENQSKVAEGASITGGTVGGTLENKGTVTDASITGTVDNTNGTVTSTGDKQTNLSQEASITGGTVSGNVENQGTIKDSSVDGEINNDGGTLTDTRLSENTEVSGGTLSGTTENKGTITGSEVTGTMTNEGTITDGTIKAAVDNTTGIISSTDGNQTSISQEASITGGTVEGKTENAGTITDAGLSGEVSGEGTLNDPTMADDTVISGATINISDGTTLENKGTIQDATVKGAVDNTNGTIDGGTLADNTQVTGGTISGNLVNEGSITDATFTGSVDNTNGTIGSSDGEQSTLSQNASITGGTINGTVENKGTINNGTITGTVDNTEGTIGSTGDGQTLITDQANVTGGTITGNSKNSGKVSDGTVSGQMVNNGTLTNETISGNVDNTKGTVKSQNGKTVILDEGKVTDGNLYGNVENYGTIYRSDDTEFDSSNEADDDATDILNKGNLVCDKDLTVGEGASLSNGKDEDGSSAKLIVGGDLNAIGEIDNTGDLLCRGDVKGIENIVGGDIKNYEVYDKAKADEAILQGSYSKIYTLDPTDSCGLLTVSFKTADPADATGSLLEDLKVSTLAKIVDECLTEEEVSNIKAGKYDMELQVLVTLNPSETADVLEDKAQMEALLASGNYADRNMQLGNLIDITIEKKTSLSDTWEKVTDLSSELEFTTDIPENLIADGRMFYIVRNHDGVCEVLTNYSSDKTHLVFRTGLFSTYAIAYVDDPNSGNKANPPKTDDPTGASGSAVFEVWADEEGKREEDEDAEQE